MLELDHKELKKLRELVESPPRKIVIVTHTNPDGDAVGSSLAWGAVLESKGHDVTYVIPNRYPSFLDWMENISKFRIFKDDQDGKTAEKISQAEIIFCLDFNQIGRLEGLGETIMANKTAKYVLIDHHLDAPGGFDLVFSYSKSSSTSFLVYKIIENLYGEDAITRTMGEELFVGIMTDTGNFAFSFLTAELFRAVATLVDKGVDIPKIHCLVYNSFTVERVKLLGFALSKMETINVRDVGVAYITLREAELRRFKFQPGDSEGFVNYPLTVSELSMSVIFIETRHFIRVSLRSRGDVDVSLFGRLYFEGGGHKNAAGGKSYRGMADTIAYFRKCVEEFFSDDTNNAAGLKAKGC